MTKFKNIHFDYLSEDKEEQQHTPKQHPIVLVAQKIPRIASALEILERLEISVADELYCERDDSRLLPLRVENGWDDSFTESLTSQDIGNLVAGLNEIRYILEHQENTYPLTYSLR